jgi:hypothetical protein
MDSRWCTFRQLDSIHPAELSRERQHGRVRNKVKNGARENESTNEALTENEFGDKKMQPFERTATEVRRDSESYQDQSGEIGQSQSATLEEKLADNGDRRRKMKEEWGESRSDFETKASLEFKVDDSDGRRNEERHRSQLDALEVELRQERESAVNWKDKLKT